MRKRHLLAALALGLCGDPAAAQEGKEMRLVNAGFVMRAANTPQALARIRKLPPRKFVARTKAGGRYYLYADPDYCRCVLLGDARAMQAYRDMVSPPTSAPTIPVAPRGETVEGEMIHDIDADIGGFEPDDILEFRF